jgi:hypothetical protein
MTQPFYPSFTRSLPQGAFSVWGILQGFAATVTLIWFLALVYQETKAVTESFRYNKTR